MRTINALLLALLSTGVLAHHDEPTRVISTQIEERLRVIELINVTAEKEVLDTTPESQAVAALLNDLSDLDSELEKIQSEDATGEK
jgi:hypothetical protein